MGVFVCKVCGNVKEDRCKPKTCKCGAAGSYDKVQPEAKVEEKK